MTHIYRIKASMINDLHSCRYKFFKNYLEQPREQCLPTLDLYRAQFFRDRTARHFRSVGADRLITEDRPDLDPDHYVDEFTSLLERQRGIRYQPPRVRRHEDHAKPLRLLVEHLRYFLATGLVGYEILHVNHYFDIDAPILVSGMIDLVVRSENGEIVIIFWRTGKQPRSETQDRLRASFALLWAQQTFGGGENMRARHVFLREEGFWRDYVLAVHERRWVIEQARKYHMAMNASGAFETQRSQLCDWCQWYSTCPEFVE